MEVLLTRRKSDGKLSFPANFMLGTEVLHPSVVTLIIKASEQIQARSLLGCALKASIVALQFPNEGDKVKIKDIIRAALEKRKDVLKVRLSRRRVDVLLSTRFV